MTLWICIWRHIYYHTFYFPKRHFDFVFYRNSYSMLQVLMERVPKVGRLNTFYYYGPVFVKIKINENNHFWHPVSIGKFVYFCNETLKVQHFNFYNECLLPNYNIFFSFSFFKWQQIHFLQGQLKFINLITFYFLNCNSNAKKVYKLGTYLKIEYSFSNHREY